MEDVSEDETLTARDANISLEAAANDSRVPMARWLQGVQWALSPYMSDNTSLSAPPLPSACLSILQSN